MSWVYNTFERKGYGRIFVEKEEDIPKVREIIRKMDEYEYEHYLPSDIIAVFNPKEVKSACTPGKTYVKVELAYTHKFDSIDLNELTMRCWMEGIRMFCWPDGTNSDNEIKMYPSWTDESGKE